MNPGVEGADPGEVLAWCLLWWDEEVLSAGSGVRSLEEDAARFSEDSRSARRRSVLTWRRKEKKNSSRIETEMHIFYFIVIRKTEWCPVVVLVLTRLIAGDETSFILRFSGAESSIWLGLAPCAALDFLKLDKVELGLSALVRSSVLEWPMESPDLRRGRACFRRGPLPVVEPWSSELREEKNAH